MMMKFHNKNPRIIGKKTLNLILLLLIPIILATFFTYSPNLEQIGEDTDISDIQNNAFNPSPSQTYGTPYEFDYYNDSITSLSSSSASITDYYRYFYLKDHYGANFIGGEISINWETDFNENTNWAWWQYSKDQGSTWKNFTELDSFKSTNGNWSLHLDLRQAHLGGYETGVWIRCVAHMNRQSVIRSSYVHIHSFHHRIFTASFQDNSDNSGNIDNLDDGVQITVNFHRYGIYSNLTSFTSDYVIHYTTDGSDPTLASPYVSASGSFSGDDATLSYTIYVNSNATVKYRLSIAVRNTNPPFYYLSQIFTVQIYDGIAPVVYNNSITINHGDDVYYDDWDIDITADVTDSGGYGLHHAVLYYRIGNSNVDKNSGNNDGSVFNDSISGNSDTAWFTLPESAMEPYQKTYIIIYVYDNSYNEAYSEVVEVDPIPNEPPLIYDFPPYNNSEHLDNRIEYSQTDFQLYFNLTTNSSREHLDTQSVFILWKINSTPTDPLDCDGSVKSTIPDVTSYAGPFPDSGLNIRDLFSLNDVVYFWINVNDTRDNMASNYDNPKMFTIVDTKAPVLTQLIPIRDINYTDNVIFSVNFNEPDGAAGVKQDSIYFYYRINNNTFNPNECTPLTPTAREDSPNDVNLTFNIANTEFNYQDIIYIWYNCSDNFDNTKNATLLGLIHIIDEIVPEISIISGYFNTNLSYARTYYDLVISISAFDVQGGAGIKNVSLVYRNGLDFNWLDGSIDYTGSEPVYILNETKQITARYDSNTIKFLIPKDTIKAGMLFVKIRAYDYDGNYYTKQIQQYVIDQNLNPTYTDFRFGNFVNIYINTQSFTFTLSIDYDSLMYIYLDGQRMNDIPINGTYLEYEFTNLTEGEHTLRVDIFNITNAFYKKFWIDITPPQPIDVSTIQAEYKDGHVVLSWQPPEGDEDSQITYFIYVGDSPDFDVQSAYLLTTTNDLSYSYIPAKDGTYYYKIVAKDRAGNLSEPSEAIMVKVSSMNTSSIIIIAVSAVAGVAVLVLVRNRMKNREFMTGDDLDKFELREEGAEGEEKEKEEEIWEDLDAASISLRSQSGKTAYERKVSAGAAERPAEATAPHRDVPRGANIVTLGNEKALSDEEIIASLTGDLKELYNNAQEFIELGQESMAIQSYEMMLAKAEQIGNKNLINFIKKKMDEIY